jgi:hypothetical protein
VQHLMLKSRGKGQPSKGAHRAGSAGGDR